MSSTPKLFLSDPSGNPVVFTPTSYTFQLTAAQAFNFVGGSTFQIILYGYGDNSTRITISSIMLDSTVLNATSPYVDLPTTVGKNALVFNGIIKNGIYSVEIGSTIDVQFTVSGSGNASIYFQDSEFYSFGSFSSPILVKGDTGATGATGSTGPQGDVGPPGTSLWIPSGNKDSIYYPPIGTTAGYGHVGINSTNPSYQFAISNPDGYTAGSSAYGPTFPPFKIGYNGNYYGNTPNGNAGGISANYGIQIDNLDKTLALGIGLDTYLNIAMLNCGLTGGFQKPICLNTNGGGVAINKTSVTNTYTLDVNGSILASDFNATSDYRLKTNINPLDLNIYNTDNIRPVMYNYKKSNKLDIGLIAHELQETLPFLVTGEKDGTDFQAINYIGLIGVLIKEVQELKKRVTTLENKLENNQ